MHFLSVSLVTNVLKDGKESSVIVRLAIHTSSSNTHGRGNYQINNIVDTGRILCPREFASCARML